MYFLLFVNDIEKNTHNFDASVVTKIHENLNLYHSLGIFNIQQTDEIFFLFLPENRL